MHVCTRAPFVVHRPQASPYLPNPLREAGVSDSSPTPLASPQRASPPPPGTRWEGVGLFFWTVSSLRSGLGLAVLCRCLPHVAGESWGQKGTSAGPLCGTCPCCLALKAWGRRGAGTCRRVQPRVQLPLASCCSAFCRLLQAKPAQGAVLGAEAWGAGPGRPQ